jgi:NAD(P)-dependent dehydrogenase (short-subunit alcohol dehydrogenase family)
MSDLPIAGLRFDRMTVIVTGGSGGLGWPMCVAFARAGARVVVADMTAPDPELLAEAAGDIRYFLLDVTSEREWIRMMDRVDAELGGLDVLVNNAGYYRPNIAFEDMPIELWRRHFAINADGVFLGCKHAIRRMKPRGGGAIVNMGSGMSITANATGAAYCATKAAVLMTTRTAALAGGPHNIRVNAVLPGAVPTAMLMGNMVEGEQEADFLAKMETYGALGRLASPEDIARAVLFLADPENRAITGVFLPVDGGALPGC